MYNLYEAFSIQFLCSKPTTHTDCILNILYTVSQYAVAVVYMQKVNI